LKELLENSPWLAGHPAERARTDACRFRLTIAMRVENEPHRCSEGRTADVVGEPANLHRRAAANRQIEDLLRDLRHPFENRAAAGEDDSRVERLLVTRTTDLV